MSQKVTMTPVKPSETPKGDAAKKDEVKPPGPDAKEVATPPASSFRKASEGKCGEGKCGG